MKRIVLCTLSAVLLSTGTSAFALFGDDEARKAILELRDQLAAQQSTQMELYTKIEELSKDLRSIRGEVDNLKNSLGNDKKAAESMIGDLSSRLEEMDPKAKAAKVAADREISAQQEFEKCNAFFKKAQADAAITCFTALAKNYKQTKVYPEALYWLGSSYYLKGNYNKVIEVEKQLLASFSKHDKTPEAYLMLGSAQLSSNKAAEGKATFQKLIKLFPSSNAAKEAKKQLQGLP